MAGIIMGHVGGQSGPHRQSRLDRVKRLNLRLFVHSQHQRPLRRVEIKPDDIGQPDVRIAAELEGLHLYPVEDHNSARCDGPVRREPDRGWSCNDDGGPVRTGVFQTFEFPIPLEAVKTVRQ